MQPILDDSSIVVCFTALLFSLHNSVHCMQSLYKQVAQERVVNSIFLYTNNQSIAEALSLKHTPTLVVMKDLTHYEYKGAWFRRPR